MPADMKKFPNGIMPLAAVAILPSPMSEDWWPKPHWTIILQYFSRSREKD
jgi:hypothetical protein